MGTPRKTHFILLVAGGLLAATALLVTRTPAARGGALPPTAPLVPVPPAPQVAPPSFATPPPRLSWQLQGGALSLEAQLSGGALLQGGDGRAYLSLLVAGKKPAGQRVRPPVNLALVIDRSGSMSGEKIEHARRAALDVIDRLDERDRIAIVDFGTDVRVLAPSTTASEASRRRLKALVAGLQANGGTHISGGLLAGMAQVQSFAHEGHVNRILLMSDGQANEGITTAEGLGELGARATRRGITVSTLGLGLDYNENVMTRIAEMGGGQYYYVRDAAALARVFAGELELAAATVAQDVTVRLRPAAGVRIEQVIGYPHETAADGSTVVQLRDVAAGQVRRVLVALRVPVDSVGARDVAQIEARFRDAAGPNGGATAERVLTTGVGLKVTADAAEVSRSRNVQVLERVAEVELANTVNLAMDAYDRGDVQKAQRLFEGRVQAIEQQNAQLIRSRRLDAKLRALRAGTGITLRTVAPQAAAGRHAIKIGKKAAYDALR